MIFSHFYETFASFYATPNWQLALRSSPMEQPIKCNLWPLFSKSVKRHEMKISFKWCSVDSFSGWKNQVSERSYLLCSWEGMPRTYVMVHPSAPFRSGCSALMKCMNPSLTVALLKCGKGLAEKHLFWRWGTHLFILCMVSGARWLPQLIALTSCPAPAGLAPMRKCSWLVYG